MTTIEQLRKCRRGESAFYWRKQRFVFQSWTEAQNNMPPQLHGRDARGKHWTFPVQHNLLDSIDRVVLKARKFASRKRMQRSAVTGETARSAGFAHETNDCTVHALSICADIPYAAAHAWLKSQGRKDGKGVRFFTFMLIKFKQNGFAFRIYTSRLKSDLDISWNGLAPHMTLARLLKHPNLPERMIVSITGHVIPVINGVLHDCGAPIGTSRRVHDVIVWEKIK